MNMASWIGRLGPCPGLGKDLVIREGVGKEGSNEFAWLDPGEG